ncbi:MAG: ABC transporter permease [Candidatus Thorarchaeota archaeon]
MSYALLRANLKNVRMLVMTLFFPVFMLFTFWISTRWDDPSEFDLMRYMYPAIVAISVMLTGQTLATRLNNWREQNIFQRLTLTSIDITTIMLGMAVTQIIMGIIQGLAILLIGVFLLEINISFLSFLLILGVIIITGMTFIAYGTVIATLTRKSEMTGYAFFFSLLPLFFLASFPTEMLPPSIQVILPWLPTWMSIELIESAIYAQVIPANGVFMIIGLVIYIIIFGLISGKFYNWED